MPSVEFLASQSSTLLVIYPLSYLISGIEAIQFAMFMQDFTLLPYSEGN